MSIPLFDLVPSRVEGATLPSLPTRLRLPLR